MKEHLQFARKLIKLLDTRFSLLGIKFGIDPILNFIPGFGSLIGAVISCYLFWIGYKMKVRKRVHLRMLANIALDYFLGIIPGVGIVADIFYRANVKNFAILEKSLDLRSGSRSTNLRSGSRSTNLRSGSRSTDLRSGSRSINLRSGPRAVGKYKNMSEEVLEGEIIEEK